MYLRQGHKQETVFLVAAAKAQVAVCGVEGPGRVCAGVGRPHRAGGHLVQPLGPGQPEQSQDVLSQGLLLQNPGDRGRVSPLFVGHVPTQVPPWTGPCLGNTSMLS